VHQGRGNPARYRLGAIGYRNSPGTPGRRRPGSSRPPGRPVRRSARTQRRVSASRRLRFTLLCIAFALSVFIARLVQVQAVDSATYRSAAERVQLATIRIPAVRGDILSSNGAALAMTIQTYTVFADPKLIPGSQRPGVAASLAGPLEMPAPTILGMINHPSSPEYQVLRIGISVTAGARISALRLPGIDMHASYTTTYPDGNLAADIVGFTDPSKSGDGSQTGAAGLELQYNVVLAGRDGSEEVQEGVDREPIPLTETKLTPAVQARSLRLTIQSDIQWKAEQVCKLRVEQTHARNCSIVVMQPKTGAILAMAQWPTYDPANVTNYAATTNISVANVFAPGSTLKPITVAAALEKGGQMPMSAYTIPYSITMDGRYTFHDAELHPTVRYTIAGILAHSSNVGMVQVAQHITPEQQYDYLRAFGLGSVSGLDVPGESAGLIPPPGSPGYYPDNRYEYAFGQGVGVTAVQMASVYATIANGGVRVQPRLVAGTISASGHFTPAPEPAGRRVIQAKTAHALMTMLQQVPKVDAEAGEPWGYIDGYPVAAKTGTAQVSDPGLSKCLCQYGSSYIGIVPANNPQLVVAVNIQDPRGKYYGDEVAGPAFFAVTKFALQTMKIAPDYARAPYIRLTAP
jgi:cell division protein FtsI (penicillin-binding protein 3)